MTDISEDISAQAVEPAASSADGQSASARPIADMITAQQFADNRAAIKKRRRGLTITTLTTPGACDVCSGAPSSNFGGC